MKKQLLFILFSAITMISSGNIATPQTYISEIYIDSIGNWTIELGFYEFWHEEIDSIRIETSSGSSIILFYNLIAGSGFPNFDSLAVITNTNLKDNLTINPDNDYVKVISYAWEDDPSDYVAFGNHPNSEINCMQPGESIAYVAYVQSIGNTANFCIDNSPSIGLANDTIGILGDFSGIIYDVDGSVFTEGWFPMPDCGSMVIHINPDGSFSERIFARRYVVDTIRIYFPPWPHTKVDYTTEFLDFCLRPDFVFNHDIITTGVITDVPDYWTETEEAVTVFPNPFNDKVSFYFRHGIPEVINEMELIIVDQNGEIVHDQKIDANQIRYDWTPDYHISSGVLIYNLLSNGRVVTSGKMIKL